MCSSIFIGYTKPTLPTTPPLGIVGVNCIFFVPAPGPESKAKCLFWAGIQSEVLTPGPVFLCVVLGLRSQNLMTHKYIDRGLDFVKVVKG